MSAAFRATSLSLFFQSFSSDSANISLLFPDILNNFYLTKKSESILKKRSIDKKFPLLYGVSYF